MADNRATLKASIKTAFQDAPGTDDDFDTIASAIADAIGVYALALKATGLDAPSGDTHNLSIG